MALAEEGWFKFCGWCGGLTDAGLYGGINTVANPDGTKSRYHMVDCWPRARYAQTGKPFITCIECGRAEHGEWANKADIEARQLCFNCLFWHEKIGIADEPRIVRINGNHYAIGDERKGGGKFSGFGGLEFSIRFNDGREITTHNLWGQGSIPRRFRERLPDNATWITQ